jgi:catechol 2,3-dioxygenase-like lactoylglutathione lyase family enzyme
VPLLSDIDHLQIAAPKGCESAARRFFGEVLGLAEIEKPEPLRARGGCWFKLGSRQLHIGVEEPFRPAGKAHPAFAACDLDAVFAKLVQHGIPCEWDQAVAGVRRFYAQDPWGNRLEFTEPTTGAIEHADLSGSTFCDVNLSGATFDDVSLAGAKMTDVNLSGLGISNANLTGASLLDCRTDGMTINGIAVADLMAAYRSSRR